MQSSRLLLKSGRSSMQIFAAFENKTSRKVDIIWSDYEGNFHLFATMQPQETMHVNTYLHHVFVFLDSINRDRLLVDGRQFYYAELSPKESMINVEPINRVVRAVHLPLRSLKSLAMLAVRDMLPDADAVAQLEIPETLKAEIAFAIDVKQKPINGFCAYIQNE